MKPKYVIAVVLTLALLLTGVAWSLDAGILGRPSAEGALGDASQARHGSLLADVDASTSGTAGRGTRGGTSATRSSGTVKPQKTAVPSPTNNGGATATRPSWNPQPAASETAGLEMPTATPAADRTLPKSKTRRPILSVAPKNGSAVGKLTPGFPKDAVPVPPNLRISSSSVASQGPRVLVGVEGRSESSPASILAFFTRDFGTKGWKITRSTPENGTTTVRGAYGNDAVVATVRRLPTGQTTLTVAGAFKIGD